MNGKVVTVKDNVQELKNFINQPEVKIEPVNNQTDEQFDICDKYIIEYADLVIKEMETEINYHECSVDDLKKLKNELKLKEGEISDQYILARHLYKLKKKFNH